MSSLPNRGTRLLIACLLAAASCTDAPHPSPLLVVQAAQQQPDDDTQGIIVVIQSMGGSWLEMSVSGGTLTGKACLAAPRGSQLKTQVTNLLVYPIRGEAVLTVSLLPDGPRAVGAEVAGAAGAAGA